MQKEKTLTKENKIIHEPNSRDNPLFLLVVFSCFISSIHSENLECNQDILSYGFVYKASTLTLCKWGLELIFELLDKSHLDPFNHSRGPDIPLTLSGMYEILDST